MPKGIRKIPRPSLALRFDMMWTPEPNTGCWLWARCTNQNGYGSLSIATGRTALAHRVAWMLHRGPIPEGMFLDHVCRVRSCVNPDHLRVVTPAVNVMENSESVTASHKKKTHCIHGHPLSGDNLRVATRGSRECRQCDVNRWYNGNRNQRRKDRRRISHTLTGAIL